PAGHRKPVPLLGAEGPPVEVDGVGRTVHHQVRDDPLLEPCRDRCDHRLLLASPSSIGSPGRSVRNPWETVSRPKEAHMAIIELGSDTLEALPEPEVDWLVEPAPAATGGTRSAALTEPLSGWWALFLTVAWVTIFTTGVALEPPPADHNAIPLLAAVLAGGLMLGWTVMAAG